MSSFAKPCATSANSATSVTMNAIMLAVLAVVSCALSPAQPGAASKPAKRTQSTSANVISPSRIEHVIARGADDALEIEVQISGPPIAPDAEVLTAPDRILIDFPGAIPAPELKSLQIHRGYLKSVRATLFFRNPPITRLLLELASAQPYQVLKQQQGPNQSVYVIKIGSIRAEPASSNHVAVRSNSPQATFTNFSARAATGNGAMLVPASAKTAQVQNPEAANPSPASSARAHSVLANSVLASGPVTSPGPRTIPRVQASDVTPITANNLASMPASQPGTAAAGNSQAGSAAAPPPQLVVTFANGMLRIHADQSTMAAVLYEVQRQTQAEIPIPAGAEQEKIVADIGPATPREVLQTLLNGSPYNFIFVGDEDKLEQVILTPRDASVQ